MAVSVAQCSHSFFSFSLGERLTVFGPDVKIGLEYDDGQSNI